MTAVNVDVPALAGTYLDVITPAAPPWMVRRQLDRFAACLHGASSGDVTHGYERALTAVGDAELVRQAFQAIWPRPELSTHAPAPVGVSLTPDPARHLSPLAERVLGALPRLAAAAAAEQRALTRRDVHRPLQRHVESVDELEAALGELAARGHVSIAGHGARATIELVPM